MLTRKLLRTMGQYKAQFISMVLMVALGVGIFLGFNMEWVSIEVNTDYFYDLTGYADYRLVEEAGFSPEEQKAVSALAGVEAASRYLSQTVDVLQRQGDALALSVTENPAVSGLDVISGAEYDPASPDGIWLSDRYAEANDLAVGDTLTLTYQDLQFQGTVKGLIKASEHMICVRDETQLMPDFATFGYAYISPAMYESTLGVAYYPQLHIRSDLDKAELTQAVDEALGRTVMVLTKDETISYAEAEGEANEGKTMGSVLPALFLLIAVLTMVTTMHRLTAQEKTQIGALKALGFRDRRIARHYTAYGFFIGILGCSLGTGLGYGIAWFIMNPNGMMGTYLDLPQWKLPLPWFCWLILGLILALLTLVGYLSARQMLRGTAAEALRPYTPRAMKPLLLERTRLWSRLGFGPRWNLRDIMRHKSRSAMSLLGAFGCALLILGSFGMQDTMDSFLSLYYDQAMGYQSRINLAEGATNDQARALIDRYHGDSSGTVAVQLGDKAVSLEVYDVPGNLVRFPDEDNQFVTLPSDGAYVCLRLGEEFSLEPGDVFTISPYGSDKTYTLRVAGLVRSVSESIIISPAYAEALDLPYTVSSIYTAMQREAIASDAAIASVQSKQTIIDSFDAFIQIMDLMIYILVLAAVVLGVVVLYNLGVMSYTERYRELATLKVVGFQDRKIGRLLIGQNLWITFAGLILGIPGGVLVLDYLLHALAGEYEMKMALYPKSYLFAVLLTLGVSLLVSLAVARKSRTIDMVAALKSAE